MSKATQDPIQAHLNSSNPVQPYKRYVNYIDWWLSLREKLLDGLSGIMVDDVLNAETAGHIPEFEMDPAVDLKRALDAVKIAAIDERGAHVDYAILRESTDYHHYRRAQSPGLKRFDPARLASRQARLAFWINLYNALVMDAVIALGIQRSVAEGKLGLLTFFRRAAYDVGGYRISLDEIEHGVLRGNKGNPFIPGRQFASRDSRLSWVTWPPEPRIHFALNCASRSCPPIQVYTADHLEAQLDLAARNFVDATVRLDQAKQSLIVSSLFKWFKGDFGGQAGVVSFLIDHLPHDGRREWLLKQPYGLRFRYEPYDWSLNTI